MPEPICCEACGGDRFTPLGYLGAYAYLRCEACGMDTVVEDELPDDTID